jgi:hypothetical protein
VPDCDLLKVFDAPQIAVLANGAQIEGRHAKRLGADLGIPAIEAAEIEVRRAVRQSTGFDWIEVVDQEEEDVAIAGIECCRILGHVDARIVDAGRPIQRPRYLPTCIACAVAGDALDGGNQFMVMDPAIVRTGDGAELDAAVLDFQRLDLFGATSGQAILEVDACKRCRKLAKICGRRANEARELAKTPVCRRDGVCCAWQDQRQPLGVVAVSFDAESRGLDDSRPAALTAVAYGLEQLRQGQEPLVIGP